ncbi:MAG: cold-shock protein [Candidatus Bathyarchaeia archaeon]
MEGTVKKWLTLRGFGFIEVDDSDDDVFVHNSELSGVSSLRPGQKVSFEIEDAPKGPRAINVKVVE